MLEHRLAQLLAPKYQFGEKPPGLTKIVKNQKDKISASKVTEKRNMDQKTGDSHDSNYALMNVKVDESSWTNNVNQKDKKDKSLFSWSWTDILEVFILLILVFFIYHFLKKKINKSREKKLTKTTRNLVSEMKARDATSTCPLLPPTCPSFLSP